MSETQLRLIAAAAIIGESVRPVRRVEVPAAQRWALMPLFGQKT